jgi:hypothetical protein
METLDNNIQSATIVVEKFEDVIIWDNSENLFDKYFRDEFITNRHRIAFFPLKEGLTLNEAIQVLKSV